MAPSENPQPDEIAHADLQAIADVRERECLTEATAYRMWLQFLSWGNLITIGLPAVFSAIAGATLLNDGDAFQKHVAAGAALASSVLVVIHKSLNCDTHQAECRLLHQRFSGLAVRYRTLLDFQEGELRQELLRLDEQLAEIRENMTAFPPTSIMSRAAKHHQRS